MAEDTLIQKIRSLPPERVAEVEDFVDFLAVREQVRHFTQAAERLSEKHSAPFGTTPTMLNATAYKD